MLNPEIYRQHINVANWQREKENEIRRSESLDGRLKSTELPSIDDACRKSHRRLLLHRYESKFLFGLHISPLESTTFSTGICLKCYLYVNPQKMPPHFLALNQFSKMSMPAAVKMKRVEN